MPELLDLSEEIDRLDHLAAAPERLDALLAGALDTLAEVIPYELASVLELDGEMLRVRIARGPLASEAVRRHRIALDDFPTLRRSMETRRPIALLDHDHAEEGDPYDGVLDLEHGHSCMVVPLHAAGRALGVITFDRSVCAPYPPQTVRLAGVYGELLGLAVLLAEETRLLQRARARLAEHNRLLREAGRPSSARALLERTRSPRMRRLLTAAWQVAASEVPVLIQGETGTGKEVLAEAIHDASPRARGPLVRLNCAALPGALVESELFGHVKGAFTGAEQDRPGRFVTAAGGTLLLDEIGELPLEVQAKLLRVLQEGTFEPVGSDRTVRVDVRVLAATHVDLEDAVARGAFREDLYYRLAVFPLELPPLRERPEDIEPIAEAFLDDLARRTGRGPWSLAPGVAAALAARPWPGNLRELTNLLERATILRPEGVLDLGVLGPAPGTAAPPPSAAPTPSPGAEPGEAWRLDAVTRAHIERVLEHTRGRVFGAGGAAEILGLKPTTLQSRMKRLGVDAARFRPGR